VEEEKSAMPRTLGRNVPVAVREHDGEVRAGEGVTLEQHFSDLGLGHVTILKALFGAGNQDRIHQSPSAHPRTSGSERLPRNLDWTTRPSRDGKTVIAPLRRTRGKVSGAGGAAELLGVRPTTLASRIKALGVSPQQADPVQGDDPA
jgi:hypothetical protein